MAHGDFLFLSQHYLASVDTAEQSDHPFVSLFDEDIEQACGFRAGLFGTRTSRMKTETVDPSRAHLNDFQIFPFEFGATSIRNGNLQLSLWKSYSIALTDNASARPQDGTVLLSEFDPPLRSMLHLLFSDEKERTTSLFAREGSRNLPDWVNATCRTLQPGNVIRFEGNTLAVLSNSVFNKNHAFGTLLVAPLVRSRLSCSGAATVDGRRIVWERSQAVQIPRTVELDCSEDDCDDRTLAVARASAKSLLLSQHGGLPPKKDLLTYLAKSRSELDKLNLPLVLTGLAPITAPSSREHARVIRTRLPRRLRAFTASVRDAIPGTDTIRVELVSPLVDVAIMRDGPALYLVIDAKRNLFPDNDLIGIWAAYLPESDNLQPLVATPYDPGSLASSLGADGRTSFGIYRASLGELDPSLGFEAIFYLTFTCGAERAHVKAVWHETAST